MKVDAEIGTYKVRVKCSNCGWTGMVEISKGTPIKHNSKCPNCGCNTLIKHEDAWPIFPRPYIPYPYDPYPNEPYEPKPTRWIVYQG